MSDTIVRVRRDVPLVPSPFVMERHRWMTYAQLEHAGPDAFDVTRLRPWFHSVQRAGGHVIGHAVYRELARDHFLAHCFGLHELEAIREKGSTFFYKYFHGHPVFGWKLHVIDMHRYAHAPCLILDKRDKTKILLEWFPLRQYVAHSVPTWLLPEGDGKVPL